MGEVPLRRVLVAAISAALVASASASGSEGIPTPTSEGPGITSSSDRVASSAKKKRKKKKKKRRASVQTPYLTLENAKAAIAVELDYRAKSRQGQSSDGSTFNWGYNDTDCYWGQNYASFTCTAYIIEDDPYECQFIGFPGRRYSADEVIVTARLVVPSSWLTTAGSFYTFKYYQCYA